MYIIFGVCKENKFDNTNSYESIFLQNVLMGKSMVKITRIRNTSMYKNKAYI